jgi:hypothetical protein
MNIFDKDPPITFLGWEFHEMSTNAVNNQTKISARKYDTKEDGEENLNSILSLYYDKKKTFLVAVNEFLGMIYALEFQDLTQPHYSKEEEIKKFFTTYNHIFGYPG